MKKLGTFISVMILLIFWQFASGFIHNDFILPQPYAVLHQMAIQTMNAAFYMTIFHTLWRCLFGLFLAFLIGGVCAFLAYFSTFMKAFLAPIILLSKSVPNISYMIIILVWFGTKGSVIIIPFLILFPIIYANLYEALQSIHQDLKNIMLLYPEKKSIQIRKYYIPLIFPAIQASLSSGLGLAFKVGVMAEIIGQVQQGIGRQLNIARLQMDMTSIFAWTFWIIIILLVLDVLRKKACQQIQK